LSRYVELKGSIVSLPLKFFCYVAYLALKRWTVYWTKTTFNL
jgi:hypothetical protein